MSAVAFVSPPLSLYAEDGEYGEQSPVAVLTQTVQSGAAKTARRYPARILAVEQVDVVSRLSADIVEVCFTEGSVVCKGQLLYRLDDIRFVATVSNQTSQIAETEAKLELATLTYDRKRKLAEKGMSPRADFDAARAAKLELEANLEAAKAALVLAVAASGVQPWVPPQALIEDGDESFVYVVEDGKANLRAVEESARLPDRVFVKSGLKAGETVIVGGTHKVSDGAAVTCMEAK